MNMVLALRSCLKSQTNRTIEKNLEPVPKATLTFAQGLTLYAGPVADTEPHSHHAIQIVFSFDVPFDIEIGSERLRTHCIAINRDVVHQFLGQEKSYLFFYVEPESEFGGQLQTKLANGYECWEKGHVFLKKIQSSIQQNGLFVGTVKKALAEALNLTPITPQLDDRIARVIDLIEKKPDRKLSIPLLAESAELSESRLQHLFKEQTGISMKRYMLWKRMIDGIGFAAHGSDLTTAAFEAGFSDAAHMSRTFKEMFGINLSKIFENSRFIQVKIENLG